MNAIITETGNGFPQVGDYVTADSSYLYRVVAVGSNITTHGPGKGNSIEAQVQDADWDEIPVGSEDDVHECDCRIVEVAP